MRVWIACFFVLFALAEFFDWIKEVNLPLPIYILGGAFLAVASNYDKLVGAYFPEFAQTNAQTSAQIITDKIITDQIITDKIITDQNQVTALQANSTPLSIESSTQADKQATTNPEAQGDISQNQ